MRFLYFLISNLERFFEIIKRTCMLLAKGLNIFNVICHFEKQKN